MNYQKISIAIFCFMNTMALHAQVKGDSAKSAREIIIENENKRRDQPDIIRNKTKIKKIQAVPGNTAHKATKTKNASRKKNRSGTCCKKDE